MIVLFKCLLVLFLLGYLIAISRMMLLSRKYWQHWVLEVLRKKEPSQWTEAQVQGVLDMRDDAIDLLLWPKYILTFPGYIGILIKWCLLFPKATRERNRRIAHEKMKRALE